MGEILKVVKSRLIRKCPDCSEKFTEGAMVRITHKFDISEKIVEYCLKCAKKRQDE